MDAGSSPRRRRGRGWKGSLSIVVLGAFVGLALATNATASTQPARSCASMATIAFEDGSRVTSASEQETGSVEYCQLTVVVPERINVIVGLPKTTWNGRYQANGNGVYAGVALPPTGAVAQGWAASSTDTGHQSALLTGEWAWSPTGMNYAQIRDFAYRANHEMAVKSKALINMYYGVPPTYSYWNGCSTGGREGITEAVRYPNDFDGIYAGAPAINWTRFIPAEEWPQVVMNNLGNFVPACKLNAVPGLVLQACDLTDGLQDGLYDPRECGFDPQSLLGKETPCGAYTQADVDVIAKIMEGPRRPDGEFLWYGLLPGASMTSLAGTVETPAGRDGNPFLVSNEWFKWFLHKDPSWDWHTITFASYATDFDQSVTEWGEVLGTNNPDLRKFRDSGGKIVIWHGLADPLIFAQGTIDYWEKVLAFMGGPTATHPFARMFLAPNVGHCSGGGPAPGGNGFAAVQKWVEEGIAPDTLLGTSGTRTRPLCLYPKVARYKGSGSIDDAQNFRCVLLSPDLTVSSPTLSKQNVKRGDKITFTTTVSNVGGIDAMSVVVRFVLDGVQLGPDRVLSTLASDATVTVSSAAWKATRGSHTVRAVVDPAGSISEPEEANNTASTSFSVT
jgi:uncharacterized repeat protein (TIGR01451 family)